MPDAGVRAALEALDLFEGADPAVLDGLAAISHPFSLAAGEYLFREGDPGDRISLLASGGLEALLRLPGGRELAVESLGAGAVIGEMAVLAERERRYSARALEATSGWAFEAADARRLGVGDQPEVMRRLGRIALDRLREQYERLVAVCVEDSRAAHEARRAELDHAGPVVPIDREPGETEYLETVLFFSQFTPDDVEQLFGDLRRLEAPRGATVIAAGEQRESVVIVLRGAVETSIRRGGLAARARLAGPGRIVGHLSIDGQPTPASSRARERSILLEVPLARIAQVVDRGDDLAQRLWRAIYADVVDALFEAQRPISRMAAAGG